jgi:hypothetical protein
VQVKPIECIVRAGELIFVPRGWWHMAINLEDGVAITQNCVSRTNLPHVLSFLRPGRTLELVSGVAEEDRCVRLGLVVAWRCSWEGGQVGWGGGGRGRGGRGDWLGRISAERFPDVLCLAVLRIRGRCNLYERFVAGLRKEEPGIMEEIEAQRESKRLKAEQEVKLSALFAKPAAGAGAALAEPKPAAPAAGGAGFSFSFFAS